MDNDFILSHSFSSYSTNGLASVAVKITNEFNENLDEDFEFSLVLDDQGRLIHHEEDFLESKMEEKDGFSVKLPLKKLFGYDSSSSSSEATDELELPAIGEMTSYCCLWKPKSNKWKKNNNSSPRGERRRRKSRGWNKLFDFFRRSNNGGEGAFVFLNSEDRKLKVAPTSKFLGSPMEVFYVRKKAEEKEGSKRKSYLPYRQQLVGFFSATANRDGY